MKLAINGFGRIGRALFVLAKQRGFKIVYVNDLMSYEQANYLLKYDSIYGNSEIDLNGIIYTKISDNTKLNFKKADIILEATGVFTLYSQNKHYNKKVIISSPSKDIKKPTIYSIHNNFKSNIISASSCTTNAIAPVLSLLQTQINIKKVSITIAHAYTSGQSLLDGQKKNDLRVARSASVNIIPLLSSVSSELSKLYPHISFGAVNVRVPSQSGMFLFVLLEVDKIKDKESLQQFITQQNSSIVKYETEHMFSSLAKDFTQSAVIHEFKILDETLISLSIMQDNERGYASRVIDLATSFTKHIQ